MLKGITLRHIKRYWLGYPSNSSKAIYLLMIKNVNDYSTLYCYCTYSASMWKRVLKWGNKLPNNFYKQTSYNSYIQNQHDIKIMYKRMKSGPPFLYITFM